MKSTIFSTLVRLFAVVAIPATLACDSGGRSLAEGLGMDADLDHHSLSPIILSEVEEIAGEFWALPSGVFRVGHLLLVSDAAADSVLHIVDAREMRAVGSFGRRGDGAREFQSVWSVHEHATTGEIWVFDIQRRQFAVLSGIDDMFAEDRALRTVTLDVPHPVYEPVPFTDFRIAMLNFGFDGRLTMFDNHGQVLASLGPLPPTQDEPPNVVQHAYQASMVRHPTRNLLSIANRHAGRMEIIDDEGTLTLAEVPFSFDPRFETRQGGGGPVMASGSDLRFGYIDVVEHDSKIIGLFSGRLRSAFPGSANYGEYLHVWDWDGSFVGAGRLSRLALSLEIDVEGRLVAVVDDPQPALVFYDIEALTDPKTTSVQGGLGRLVSAISTGER